MSPVRNDGHTFPALGTTLGAGAGFPRGHQVHWDVEGASSLAIVPDEPAAG